MDQFTAARYRLMRSLIAETPTAGKILVDLGAGPSPITAPFDCRLQILLDILSHTRPTVLCDFLEHIPLADESVDGVVAGEILEHVSRSRQFVREIARVLRPGGWLVLSVPNIVSLKYRLSFLLGRIPAHAAKADYTYPPSYNTNPRGHIRDYSFAEVRRVLGDQGLRVVAERSLGTYWHARPLVPAWLLPVTFSDNVIVKAVRGHVAPH
ncbi:MAG: methyltransferase domain-containing protein [Anaerolineales bacterium]